MTQADADRLAERWGLVGGLAVDVVERAITGVSGGFRALALDHRWRSAAYAAGAAAKAECVRDAAPVDLIKALEATWVEVMGRRGATARD